LALAKIEALAPELVVLDLHMPALGGLDVLRALGTDHPTPVIVLSGLDHEADRVIGLELGADDYVVKPFSPATLVARVRSVLRRSAGARSSSVLDFGDLRIDVDAREVSLSGRPSHVAPPGVRPAGVCARHPASVLAGAAVGERVQSDPDWQGDATVSEHVHRLRAKLRSIHQPETHRDGARSGLPLRAVIGERGGDRGQELGSSEGLAQHPGASHPR